MKTSTKDEDDTAELAKFRREWLAELQRRKAELSGTGQSTAGMALISESTQRSRPPLSSTKESIGQTFKANENEIAHNAASSVPSRNLATHPALNEDGRIASSFQISTALELALNLYRRAVAHEQRSELDQALLLYRQAFRLVRGRVFAIVLNHA